MIGLDQVENIQKKIYEIYKQQNHGLECYSDEIGDLEKLKEQLEKLEQINFNNNSRIFDILLQINIKSGKYLGQLQDDNISFQNAQRICINKFKENSYEEEYTTKNIKYIVTNIIQDIKEIKDIQDIKDTQMEDLVIDLHNYTITGMILIQNYRKYLNNGRFSN